MRNSPLQRRSPLRRTSELKRTGLLDSTEPKSLHHRSDRARWGLHLKPADSCRNCGEINGMLALHHAIPRSMSKAAKYDLRNGIQLCTRCHLGWHRRLVTLCRDIFTAEEWEFISTVQLTGQNIEPWLDERYPVAAAESEAA